MKDQRSTVERSSADLAENHAGFAEDSLRQLRYGNFLLRCGPQDRLGRIGGTARSAPGVRIGGGRAIPPGAVRPARIPAARGCERAHHRVQIALLTPISNGQCVRITDCQPVSVEAGMNGDEARKSRKD